MIDYYSIKNDKLTLDDDNLYDLFTTTVVDIDINEYLIYVVDITTECRIEEICYKIYTNYNWCEELLQYNDIIDPYNIKVGDEIRYLENPSNYTYMYKSDSKTDKKVLNDLLKANSNKSTKKANIPTIKPENLKQISIDTENGTISIINKYQ